MRIALFYRPLFSQRDGIGRVISRLANYLAAHGHEPVTFSAGPGRNTTPYTMAGLHVDAAAEPDAARKILAGCQVAIVFYVGAEAEWGLKLLSGSRVPFIMSEHYPPDAVEELSWSRSARLAAMRRAAAVHVLLPDFLRNLPGELKGKATAIANPVDMPNLFAGRETFFHPTRLISVGRLEEVQKRFSLLLHAFALLAPASPDMELVIYGEGLYREYYQELIGRLGLSGRVSLPGHTADLKAKLAEGGIFAVPSEFEAFPLAVAEASASGLPCVGFADCAGVNSLIVDGKNGLLVGERSPEALAAALRRLMDDPQLAWRLGAEGSRMMEAYAPERILPEWECLIQTAALLTVPGGNTMPNAARSAQETVVNNLTGGGKASVGPTVANALRAKARGCWRDQRHHPHPQPGRNAGGGR